MNEIVRAIQQHWGFGLCTIFVTIASFFGAVVAVFAWLYRRFPSGQFTETDVAAKPSTAPKATILSPKHCKVPEDFGYLKGSLVKVTGMVMRQEYGQQPPMLKLYTFPFDVEADIVCEFPPEKARMIRELPFRKLISVVGIAEDGIKVDIHKTDVDLTLKDCRVGKPPFGIWLKYVWHETTTVFRFWWWFG